MASEVGICNRALQKLGAKRITSLTQDSVNARACNTAYAVCRDAELRDHPWNFAIHRDQLAADATAPVFGRANAYNLPEGFLRLLPLYPEDNFVDLDWIIENGQIITDDGAPLEIRFIKQETDPNKFDSLFQEALAARIALELCEELTQSNEKKNQLRQDYNDIIKRAKRVNGIEVAPARAVDAEWIARRL